MSRKLLLLLTACALVPMAAWGAKQCQNGVIEFPSVDADGSLNLVDDLGDGTGSVCLNTNNGKFVVKASGQATNNSGATQVYKDDPELNDYLGYPGRSKLRIAKNGKAKLLIKGQAALP